MNIKAKLKDVCRVDLYGIEVIRKISKDVVAYVKSIEAQNKVMKKVIREKVRVCSPIDCSVREDVTCENCWEKWVDEN